MFKFVCLQVLVLLSYVARRKRILYDELDSDMIFSKVSRKWWGQPILN